MVVFVAYAGHARTMCGRARATAHADGPEDEPLNASKAKAAARASLQQPEWCAAHARSVEAAARDAASRAGPHEKAVRIHRRLRQGGAAAAKQLANT